MKTDAISVANLAFLLPTGAPETFPPSTAVNHGRSHRARGRKLHDVFPETNLTGERVLKNHPIVTRFSDPPGYRTS